MMAFHSYRHSKHLLLAQLALLLPVSPVNNTVGLFVEPRDFLCRIAVGSEEGIGPARKGVLEQRFGIRVFGEEGREVFPYGMGMPALVTRPKWVDGDFGYVQTIVPSRVTSKRRPKADSQMKVLPFARRCADPINGLSR
jgi:hypothetical protein